MTSLRHLLNVSLTLLGAAVCSSALLGCASPWGGSASHASGLTTQQERWWAANASQAKFVAGKGWQVPGTPGFFDASGRPLSADGGAVSTPPAAQVATHDRDSAGNIWESITGQKPNSDGATTTGMAGGHPPALSEPAADLTPEQAQWWRDNRHLARWVPPQGYVIPGVEGHFDAVGHLTRPQAEGSVAPASYQPEPTASSGGPSTYAPPGASNSADQSKDDKAPGTMTAWDRVTGRTKHDDDDDSSSLWWFNKKEKSEPQAKAAQAAGDLAFREKKYSEAEGHYSEAAALWPNSPLQEDALFMRAECLYFDTAYPAAFEAYETLLTKYKRSRHLESAVAREFAIGHYWFQMQDYKPQALLQPNLTDKTRPRLDTLGSALKIMEKVRLNDPTGPLADDSLMATASNYFVRGRFPEADYHFTLLRREYPKSEHQFQAHLLGVQAKLRIYQGPGYDGSPLKGAQELIDQTLAQFREISPDERQRLVDLKEKIVTARAERDWHTAQYYEGRGYNAAARFYYAQMLKDYPNSQVAQLVSKRVAEINDLPAEPEPRLTWVSSLIPEPRDPKRLTLNPQPASDATIKR